MVETEWNNNAQKRILIGEDERPMAKALKLKLEKIGFSVDIAENGEIALEKMSQEHYDLIILDLIMPILNGFAVLDRITQIDNFNTPIIIASNLSQNNDVQKALDMGASDYFVKSNLTLQEIVTKIESFLQD